VQERKRCQCPLVTSDGPVYPSLSNKSMISSWLRPRWETAMAFRTSWTQFSEVSRLYIRKTKDLKFVVRFLLRIGIRFQGFKVSRGIDQDLPRISQP